MKKHIELALRFYVCFKISIYAVGKMAGGQFYAKGKLPAQVASQTIPDLSGFELAWTFFGYSYEYVLFIGVSQLVGGLLLLWDKTKLIGVAVLVPILLNIIVVDIFFQISAGALFSAIFYFVCLMIILFLNHEKIIAVVQALLAGTPTSTFSTQKLVINTLITAIAIVALYNMELFLMKML
jgi:hypothetical protein